MFLRKKPKYHRFPAEIIGSVVWSYHRFNEIFRDIQERMRHRGIIISHETIRSWCYKFGPWFRHVIKKRERPSGDRWHLDEMHIKMSGQAFYLWRAVDSKGRELDIFIQKGRSKKAAIRFWSRLLGCHPAPRVIITDKLRSYTKPVKAMLKNTTHLRHKGLNNRVENARLPTRRKEKCLIKFKSPKSAQSVLFLMGKVRNIFAIEVGRYTNTASCNYLNS